MRLDTYDFDICFDANSYEFILDDLLNCRSRQMLSESFLQRGEGKYFFCLSNLTEDWWRRCHHHQPLDLSESFASINTQPMELIQDHATKPQERSRETSKKKLVPTKGLFFANFQHQKKLWMRFVQLMYHHGNLFFGWGGRLVAWTKLDCGFKKFHPEPWERGTWWKTIWKNMGHWGIQYWLAKLYEQLEENHNIQLPVPNSGSTVYPRRSIERCDKIWSGRPRWIQES